MRRWVIGAFAGLVCAAGLSAFAVTVGGFPSFPWFQAVGIGQAAPAVGESITVAPGAPALPLTFTDGTRTGQIAIGQVAGQEIQFGATTNNGLQLFTDNATRLTISAAGDVAVNDPADTGPALKVTGGSCTGSAPCALVTGTNAVLNAAPASSSGYGQLTIKNPTGAAGGGLCMSDTGGVCDPNLTKPDALDVFATSGLIALDGQPVTAAVIGGNPTCTVSAGAINAASCSRISQGVYSLTFSNGYAQAPACVASTIEEIPGAIPVVAEVNTTTTGVTVTMQVTNTTATYYDGTAYVICL